MTASDHLKQRLATGSLGGDQDEKAVEELIAENELLTSYKHNADHALNLGIQEAREFAEKYADLEAECEHHVTNINSMNKSIRALVAQVEQLEAALAQKTRECEELLSHRLNNDPSKVEWHSPRTVGHLRMQLETIDPATPIAAVYFIKLTGSDVTIARSTGIQLSWERINNETNCIDQGNKKLPKSIAVWAHENDGFGPEMLAYLGRADELKTARGMEGTVIDLLNKNDALQAQVEQLQRQLTEMDRKNIELLNDASVWRNRAINAEEELAGTNRLASRARTK